MTLQIGIVGTGRLGSAIRDALQHTDGMSCAWTIGRGPVPDQPVDVAIDVSHPDAVAAHLDWARRTGTDLVIGTTGWDTTLLRGVDPRLGVLVAPNFSLGVAVLRRLSTILGAYAAGPGGEGDGGADLAVSETHHRGKVDAPSGTALLLRDALAAGAGRPAADVQTTALRLGAVVGRHEVRCETTSESITITHEAHDRSLFARGALSAAAWVHGRPGVHTIDDLAADLLPALSTPDHHQQHQQQERRIS